MMKEWYKKYRPRKLEEVIGNESTIEALQCPVEDIPHCILVHGPSGCGKTTIARIVAKQVGCHMGMDFHEINAADTNGINTIREIQRSIRRFPRMGDATVYLLDECHNLSKEAQTAALKIFEDTPEHVYFILATTEPQKLIKTIINRAMDMPVELLTAAEMQLVSAKIEKAEKVKITHETAKLLIESAAGSARLYINLLQKIASLPEAKRAAAIKRHVEESNEAIDLCRALIAISPWPKVAAILRNLKSEPEQARRAVIGYARSVLVSERGSDAATLYQAYNIIDAFKAPFYDTTAPGLLACAAFEAIHRKQ